MNVIKNLQKSFKNIIGFSDNGDDLLVPLIAVSLGAKIIEKHFTLDKKLSGPDHSISTNPKELTELVKNIRKVEKILGSEIKECQPSELQNRVEARRSITAKVEILQGEKIKKEQIDFKRPATGIAPKYIKKVIGKTAKKKIQKDESIKWNKLS